LIVAIGTEEHLGRVRTTGFGVGVKQFFGAARRSSSSSKKANSKNEIARLREELRSELKDQLRSELKDELRREMSQQLESIALSQQHTPVHEPVELATGRRVSTMGSCATEDEEDYTNTDTYRCRLFVGEPPQLVAIGRVYGSTSTIHTVPLGHDFTRVVVEDVRPADAEVSVPTSEVRFVGEALGTFIAWPTHLLQPISRRPQVCYDFT